MAALYRSCALNNVNRPAGSLPHRRRAALLCAAAAALASVGLGRTDVNAATVVWDGGTNGAGTAWLTGTNWSPDLTTNGPEANDLAVIEAGTGATIGINANGATNNGANNQGWIV